MKRAKFNTAWANLAAVLLLCAITTGLAHEPSPQAVPCLVPEDQQSGTVGVFKSSFFDPGEWHHTATIHGWADDIRGMC